MSCFFVFNETATTEIYTYGHTLSLHDSLPISVRAMVGGTDYVASNYNRATQAVRQPGSAWKLFVYMAALEAGYKVDDQLVDEPVTIQGWSPRNSSGRFAGPMSVRTAFAYSVNTIAAELGRDRKSTRLNSSH